MDGHTEYRYIKAWRGAILPFERRFRTSFYIDSKGNMYHFGYSSWNYYEFLSIFI